MVKNLPANAGVAGSIPGLGRSPGGGNDKHSSTPAWRISWPEEPGELHTVRGASKELDATEHTQHGVLPHPFLLQIGKNKTPGWYTKLGSLWGNGHSPHH